MPLNSRVRVLAVLLVVTTVVGCDSIHVPPGAEIAAHDQLIFLDQGWTDEERRKFYHWSQGSQMLPYRWILALDRLGSNERFLDNRYLASFGFIPDEESEFNEEAWPVGFAKDKNRASGEEYFGLTCAACHTRRITFQEKIIQIDGAPARVDLNSFGAAMVMAVMFEDKLRFDRFAKKAIAENVTAEQKRLLREETNATVRQYFHAIWDAKKMERRFDLQPTKSGYGRLDALGNGGNNVFGAIKEENRQPANGHVTFPELWDAPRFNWAQYTAAIRQPLGRNVGEALGVFSRTNLSGPAATLYESSIRLESLDEMEELLKKLKAPPWPEDIFGAIDRTKAQRGAALYEQLCAHCHTFVEDGEVLRVKKIKADRMGVDMTMANNFINRKVDTGDLGFGTLSAAEALTAITTRVIEKKFQTNDVPQEERERLSCCAVDSSGNCTCPNLYDDKAVFRPRPLNGAWASSPYLHNGSVPNMYQLLSPVEKRDKTFHAGAMEYDPVLMGFELTAAPYTFLFDTSIEGNHNTGHEFDDGGGPGVIGRKLTHDEKMEIIEFIKTLDEPPTFPARVASVENSALH